MGKLRHSIFHKLFAAILLISLIPLFIMGLLFYGFSSELLEKTVLEHAYSNITKSNEDFEILLNEYDNLMVMLSSDNTIKDVLSGKKNLEVCYNEIYQKIYLSLSAKMLRLPIYIIDSHGDNLISISRSVKISFDSSRNWGIFRNMRENPSKTVLYPQRIVENPANIISLSMGRCILDDKGNIIGFVMIDIPREALADKLRSIGNGDIILLDQYFYTLLNLRKPSAEGKFLDINIKNIIKGVSPADNNSIGRINKPRILLYTSPKTGLMTLCTVPIDLVTENYLYIKRLLSWILIISLGLCLCVSYILVKNMVTPINTLVSSMHEVERGNFSARVKLNRKDEIGVLGENFNKMVQKLKQFVENNTEKQKRIRSAEIKVLQSQINPHFLYNTLDTIKWIAKLNGVEDICTISTDLGKLLRSSINNKKEFMTIRESISLIESYLNIQKIRYVDELEVNINIDNDIMEYTIPKLILQPIVENAIVHGIESKCDKGHINVTGRKCGKDIVFQIIDDGIGMTQEQLDHLLIENGDDHIGLYNVLKRIRLYYGESYGVNVEAKVGVGTKVTVRIPQKLRGDVFCD